MDEDTQLAVQASAAGYYDGSQYDSDDEMPTMGEKNGVVLADLAGASYEDEQWDALLDELSFKDMTTLVNVGGWQTAEIKSIEKRATSDCDGPAGLNNFVTGLLRNNVSVRGADGTDLEQGSGVGDRHIDGIGVCGCRELWAGMVRQ